MVKKFQFGESEHKYFNRINANSKTGKINARIDQFWLCAFVGILYDEQAEPGKDPAGTQMVDKFFAESDRNQQLLRATVFYKYVTKFKHESSKESLINAMNIFFDENSPAKLDDKGYEMFNKYAAGGFKIIKDDIGEVNDLAEFLIEYVDLINKKI